ncbi:MAG: DNA polymerase III subunit beta [Candidatus Binatia bacterium]
MEFEIERAEFLEGLRLTQGVVERRNTLPILSNTLIEPIEGGVSILATDLDVGVRRSCKAKVKGSGAITVNARKIFELVKEMTGNAIRVRGTENHRVEVQSGKTRLNLVGLDPKEFPSIPGLSAKPGKAASELKAQARLFASMIEGTLFAVSLDETRLNLSGVYFENHGGALRMVATDGHRLAMIDRTIDGKVPEKGVILPRKGLVEAKKLLEAADVEEDIATLWVDGPIAKVNRGQAELFMRLIEGEFPDYRQVIPKQSKAKVTLGREEFLRALGCLSVLSTERAKGVKLTLKTGALEVQANNPDAGEGVDEIEVAYSGEELSIGFNGRYLIEALVAMRDGERVDFLASDDVSPGILRPEGDDSYCYVVMPMRL